MTPPPAPSRTQLPLSHPSRSLAPPPIPSPPRPPDTQILSYAMYWLVILVVLQVMADRKGLITQKTVAAYRHRLKIISGITLFWYFLTFIWACAVRFHPFQAFILSIFGTIGLIGCMVACSGYEGLSQTARRRGAYVNFFVTPAVLVFTIICLLVQLDCLGKDECPGFATSFYYVFFVFNRSYQNSLREETQWRGGAILTMSLVYYLFYGYFHCMMSWYVLKDTLQGRDLIPYYALKGEAPPSHINAGKVVYDTGSSSDSASASPPAAGNTAAATVRPVAATTTAI
jgi:hypothetical protein